jgi:deaminated glutathione amidase
MPDLQVTLVQRASSLDPAQNRRQLAVLDDVSRAQRGVDLVVLPEAFARDFGPPGSDLGAYAEGVDGPFVEALGQCASRHGLTVVAGMFEASDDPARPYNTLVVVGPDGLRATYRKIHLYDSFGYRESDRLSAGEVDPVLVEVGDVVLGLMTCYDLRFPELARELVRRGAQLLVVPSAWVAGPAKMDHWLTLVRARAIENTVFVAAAGQPGPRYCGHSLVVGPAGEDLGRLGDGEDLLTATVDTDDLDRARRENPSLLNRRL